MLLLLVDHLHAAPEQHSPSWSQQDTQQPYAYIPFLASLQRLLHRGCSQPRTLLCLSKDLCMAKILKKSHWVQSKARPALYHKALSSILLGDKAVKWKCSRALPIALLFLKGTYGRSANIHSVALQPFPTVQFKR